MANVWSAQSRDLVAQPGAVYIEPPTTGAVGVEWRIQGDDNRNANRVAPGRKRTDETFDRTAPSFDNPDFVDVVIHSYRHRIGNAPGELRFQDTERRLAKRPPITVPSIVLYGADDGVLRPTRPRPLSVPSS
jgi:pimeloyl-ACP methyl ester carboxylesterase